MKKIQNRTMICVIFSAIFILGICFFLIELGRNVDKWTIENYYAAIGYTPTTNFDIINGSVASDDGHRVIYYEKNHGTKEALYVRGVLTDRNGLTLAIVSENGISYNANSSLRTATLHLVGDRNKCIATGALKTLSSNFSRYITEGGEYTATDNGNQVTLSVDANVNQIALDALGSYKGTVGVYNYKTGEILCMVSTPSYDPDNIPTDIETNSKYSGAYLNRFYSSVFTPGSIMKTVTLQAAIDTIPDLYDQTFTCNGSMKIGNQTLNCTGYHGTQHIADAYANSCNVAFAQIALQLNKDTMQKVVDKANLTSSYRIEDAFSTKAGSFDLIGDTNFEFAWSCIGLHHDLVNPLAMMSYIGAVANEGISAKPTTLKAVYAPDGEKLRGLETTMNNQYISPSTANKMKEIMIGNTTNHAAHYQSNRFNVSFGAKTGTIDRTDGGMNGWFVGFVNEEEYPYAFVCYVEEGGYGVNVAGGIAAEVVNALCK